MMSQFGQVLKRKIGRYAALVVLANYFHQNSGQTLYPDISIEHPVYYYQRFGIIKNKSTRSDSVL